VHVFLWERETAAVIVRSYQTVYLIAANTQHTTESVTDPTGSASYENCSNVSWHFAPGDHQTLLLGTSSFYKRFGLRRAA
jgi:hypothetical protein